MLRAIARLLRFHCNRMLLRLASLWRRLVHFTSAAKTEAPEAGAIKSIKPEIDEREAGLLGSSSSKFPAATNDRRNLTRRAFIDSLDPAAVCALASQHNNEKACRVVKRDSGSFNVCLLLRRLPARRAQVDRKGSDRARS